VMRVDHARVVAHVNPARARFVFRDLSGSI
jgi:hypothetical protein